MGLRFRGVGSRVRVCWFRGLGFRVEYPPQGPK